MRKLIAFLAVLILGLASYSQSSVSSNPDIPALTRFATPDKIERQRQLPAIAAVFGRHTDPHRAQRLTYLCYEATLNTPFKPIDLAEIALVETGGHYLASSARSSEGALGVWQLMPSRARSHGFKPQDMQHDHKCVEAAVKELLTKLAAVNGDRLAAKRRYCGTGPQARAYERKTLKYRQQIMELITTG